MGEMNKCCGTIKISASRKNKAGITADSNVTAEIIASNQKKISIKAVPNPEAEIEVSTYSNNYETLSHKPKINGETLIGDKSSDQLHLQDKLIGTQTEGQNLKTINGQTLLGQGDLEVTPENYLKNATVDASGKTLTITKEDDTTLSFNPTQENYTTAEKNKLAGISATVSEDLAAHIADDDNPHDVTKAQVGLGSVVNKPMDAAVTEGSDNYISSGAVKTYVDTNGGKIDVVQRNGVDLPIVDKKVNVAVPTATSELTNDSNFQSGAQVDTKIAAHNSEDLENVHPAIREFIEDEIENRELACGALSDRLDDVEVLIPPQASATNQLGDKAFINSTVQTASANFRGNWATYSLVPTDVSLYPVDYAGSRTPTVNDYLVVQDASDYTTTATTIQVLTTGATTSSIQLKFTVNGTETIVNNTECTGSSNAKTIDGVVKIYYSYPWWHLLAVVPIVFNQVTYNANEEIKKWEYTTSVNYTMGTVGQALVGTWRFKYTGTWAVNGKSGWKEEYQVNEKPMTAAQIAAINSGITAVKVGKYDGYETGKQDTLSEGTGIDITNNVISVNDLPTEELAEDLTFTPTNTVGGCQKGTTYSNKSVKQLLEQILCPYVAFTFNSISTTPGATTYEYGSAKTVTKVTPSFSAGSRAISSVKIGSTSGASDLYEGTTATSGTVITLTTSKSLDGLSNATIYCTLSDGNTTTTKSATFTFSKYNYYTVTNSTTPPTSGGTVIGTGTQANITTTANTYIWFICPTAKTKIQQYSMSMWNDMTTTAGGTVTFTTSTGQQLTYYTYRTDMMVSSTGTYRIQ